MRGAFGEQPRYYSGCECAGALILLFDNLHPETGMNLAAFG
jgi:hypothetical protein